MKCDITVAICTYNGESRLPAVLQCLTRQVVPDTLVWEVLIVDNNSSDQTRQVYEVWRGCWGLTLRYVFEGQQGLAYARQRAVEQAHGELVAFIDDDNFPDPDWLKVAIQFARDRPAAGAFGGQTRPLLAKTPPPGFEAIAPFLAIVERGTLPFCYERSRGLLPPGAGLVVRRHAWLDCVPRRLLLTGRVNQWQLASEDLEAIVYLQNGGWEIWHNPEMKLMHQIPAYRLERDYLLAIALGTGLARYQIRRLRLRPWQEPFFCGLYFGNDLRQVIWHYLTHYHQLQTDIAAACKMVFLLGSLGSPWVIWRKSRQ
ncbi:MAG: hormogonium polysaccharide biosynthesis glycosyltransferase HpsE [Jaaginema sp. PMC 1079.18]|nr:hormogonium polysaccharide biosynthesis glycosyltransferase HpsE [Jaaginema sp. PMC 1080.18]MEC4852907.1 hormogonium polysaccharide biosynthesis glycosyltransferase HpsE [Jaaginema sp. PMC 1079.18]MEC4868858.1 hormogonium polysaccharide biosynthesis glycosyltransferase HpsE [Jaaginema sp. PMC 1078.18]